MLIATALADEKRAFYDARARRIEATIDRVRAVLDGRYPESLPARAPRDTVTVGLGVNGGVRRMTGQIYIHVSGVDEGELDPFAGNVVWQSAKDDITAIFERADWHVESGGKRGLTVWPREDNL